MQKKYSLKLFKTFIQISDGSVISTYFFFKKIYFLIETNIKSNILWKNTKLAINKNVTLNKNKRNS